MVCEVCFVVVDVRRVLGRCRSLLLAVSVCCQGQDLFRHRAIERVEAEWARQMSLHRLLGKVTFRRPLSLQANSVRVAVILPVGGIARARVPAGGVYVVQGWMEVGTCWQSAICSLLGRFPRSGCAIDLTEMSGSSTMSRDCTTFDTLTRIHGGMRDLLSRVSRFTLLVRCDEDDEVAHSGIMPAQTCWPVLHTMSHAHDRALACVLELSGSRGSNLTGQDRCVCKMTKVDGTRREEECSARSALFWQSVLVLERDRRRGEAGSVRACVRAEVCPHHTRQVIATSTQHSTRLCDVRGYLDHANDHSTRLH